MKNLITRQQEIKRTADRDAERIEAEAEIAGLRRWLSWRRGTSVAGVRGGRLQTILLETVYARKRANA